MADTNLLAALEDLVLAPRGSLSPQEELRNIKGWDSLALVGYIALVDEMFGKDLAPQQIRQCTRVQDLLDLAGAGVTP